MTPLSLPLLANKIGHACRLYRVDREGRRTSADVDSETVKQVHALLSQQAKAIACISTIPTIDAEGRCVTRSGLDESSGVYIDIAPGSVPDIPQEPTRQQVVEALRCTWQPWSAYRWATPHDRAAALAAVLLVPLRPMINAAPGWIANAAAEGAGKTLAISAIAALVYGRHAAAISWSRNEEEAKKLLLAVVRENMSALLIDNLKGTWDSEALATAMSMGHFEGRLLGGNTTASGEARTLWLASGNSVSLSRDLARRFTASYIDPGTATPQALSFAFNPELSALAARDVIVASILTIHRAWHAAGRLGHDGKDCGFLMWARTIRAMVCWLQESGIADEAGIGTLGDAAHAILTLEAAKGDVTAQIDAGIVLALHGAFGSAPFETGEARDLFQSGRKLAEGGTSADDDNQITAAAVMFFEAIAAIKPECLRMPQGISTQSLSAILRNRRGRRIGKIRIEIMAESERSKTWYIATD